MHSIRINEAQARLGELVDSLAAEGEILITRDEQPVARLTGPVAQPSLGDIKPVSVGAVLRPLSHDDDLLEEMLGA